MGHHRYARRDQARDHFGLLHAAFQLHGLAAGLLQDPSGVFDRPINAQVKTGKRHIDDQQGMAHRTADHLGVIDHLFQRHRQRVGMALHDHREAVADQNALDAGRIDQLGRGIVVGGEHGDLPPGGFHRRELGNRDGALLGVHVEVFILVGSQAGFGIEAQPTSTVVARWCGTWNDPTAAAHPGGESRESIHRPPFLVLL